MDRPDPEDPTRSSRPRFRVRSALLVVLLIALVLALAIQSRRLDVQAQQVSSLEAAVRRVERQNIQLANSNNQSQQARFKELGDLRREIEAVRSLATPPGPQSAASPSPPSSISIPAGEWVQETVERGGVLVNSGLGAARVHLFVDGDAFRSEVDGKAVSRWTITFDPSKRPARFDARIEDGKYQGQFYRGLYRVEGDRWTYCFGPPGSARPTELASPKDSGISLVVARRAGAH